MSPTDAGRASAIKMLVFQETLGDNPPVISHMDCDFLTQMPVDVLRDARPPPAEGVSGRLYECHRDRFRRHFSPPEKHTRTYNV
jgi:hypothetical protein